MIKHNFPPPPFFKGGGLSAGTDLTQSYVGQTVSDLERTDTSSSLNKFVLDFRYVAAFLNESDSCATVVEN